MYSYSEAGSRPLAWDRNQKGTITFNDYGYYYYDYGDYDDSEVMKFMSLPMNEHSFVKLSLVEYVFVSLCLAVIIAKFFPAIHNQIVSTVVNSLEYQSLYWGSAVVTNVFTYGLVFVVARGWNITLQYWSSPNYVYKPDKESLYVLSIQEFLVYVIFFVGALYASLRNHHNKVIAMPTGMGKVMINISFCFSCFCFCICCSQRCRAKTLQALILFSFMSFIYHIIMDVYSLGFILFIEEFRTFYISLTLLYMSLILFFVMFTSITVFLISRGRSLPFYKRSLNCFGGSFILIIVFGAVMLIVIMYMVILFSLKLTGIGGIITGLIPSIALSAVSWYIKKRLQREEVRVHSTTSSEYGATDEMTVNDGGSEVNGGDTNDEQIMLLP